jgi:Family of unknown function (DUF6205)
VSGDTTITGAITIDPPLTWAQARDSIWLNTKRDPERTWYREVWLRVVEDQRDTDDGVVAVRTVDAIVPVPGETSGYTLTEQIQRIVDEIGPGHAFAGHLECTWHGRPIETWRVVVRDGTVAEVRPQVLWPGEAVPGYEPAVDSAGEVLWLDSQGDVAWLAADEDAPEGWRRLYVAATAGGAA